MVNGFCQVTISATSKQEADELSDKLLNRKLIAGALILRGPSRYWWKGKIVEKEYYNVQAFTVSNNKGKIISEVKEIHKDECPIIAFSEIDGNQEFLSWIKDAVE